MVAVGKGSEILAGSVEAAALQTRRNPSYFHFCGLPGIGDARLLSFDRRRLPEFRHARPFGKRRSDLQHHHRLRRHHCFSLHGDCCNSPPGFQTCAVRCAGTVRQSPHRGCHFPSLSLIAILMVADSLFAAARAAAPLQAGHLVDPLAAFSLPWMLQKALASTSVATLGTIYFAAYLLHELTFYFLLCYRPFGIQFHVETSLFNIYFAKLDREILKPVRYGVRDEHLDQVKSFGVKTFEDFTWKHMLDFYSCADCGRCSDNCPANAVGRPLSPRFLTIKAR